MNTAAVMRNLALLLIVVGLVAWFASIGALVVTRESTWRFGVAVGALLVFVGCCLWHAARIGGAR